ncbi:PorP/SprF family type IX secretion system membrane protein [Marinifilum caeruleilacunae]|uniref:Type IX secretion system membrane protein PorP/SprF n=1 Tax=Marinifilum caeruleilacunae TaxID=2499076 RepID=A0ABX1WV61_9BACT|nr:PorP/SprF family type IX secretion system membrane protein [Marinifilum caeruleilacunae]NOU59795.1 type IX secretion system membrane protein PorP/SprF [Marinifilum caeruleilacunae]
MKKALIVFCVLFFGSLVYSFAQDIRFSQFYANKLYLNPALAGSTNNSNVSLNYRNQWPNLDLPYVTYSVAFDNFYEALNGGIGIMVIQDDQGDGALKTTTFAGMYSFYLRINDEFVVRPAIQAAFMQKKVDWQNLVFPDQVSPIYGNIFPHNSSGDPVNRRKDGWDFSLGTIAYYKDYYFGIAAHHLAKPDLSFDDEQEDKLQTKYTVHAGAEFVLGGRGRTYADNWVIAPALLYQKQGDFSQMNYGVYASKSSIVFGLWFNQNFEPNYDSFIAMAGFVTERFKVAYSYDYAISKLIHTNTGAHEISFSFPLSVDTNKRRKRIKAVRSPVF